MASRSKKQKLLEYINQSSSDDYNSNIGNEDGLSDTSENTFENEFLSSPLDTGSDIENIFNVRRRRRAIRLPSYSDDSDTEVETALDGTVWELIKPESLKRPGIPQRSTTFKASHGPTAFAKRHVIEGKVSSAFFLIINKNIINYIRKCTEMEASTILGKEWVLSEEKFYSFLAILYGRGAYEAKNLKLSYLWSKKWGPEFFRKTMSRKDFTDILKFIRFDMKNERSKRLKSDKFALISNVWNPFIKNCQNCYAPGQNITIDEQLFPTKARCKFTQYMPNKPSKFGIKFWIATDLTSKYTINAFPYSGKNENKPASISLGEFVALKLIEPFTGCGRNVTTDNFFTSKSLASKLLEKNTTLVGTIRSNKKELPKSAKQKVDNLPKFSSLFYKSNICTLTVYKAKKNKKVLLLSSKHTSQKIEQTRKKLPETISFYNHTKYGVDIMDQMAKKYTVKSGSQRWPLQVFFNILDIAGINSWIIYKELTGTNITRKDFLFQLAEELSTGYQESFEQENLNELLMADKTENSTRKCCQIGFCNENKTTHICIGCKKYVCGKCTTKTISVCINCANKN